LSKSKKKAIHQDPYAQREAEKYDNPIPSREFILDLMDKASGPVSHPALCEQLKLTDEDEVEALRRRLIAMARDGQLISNRKGDFARLDKTDLVRCRVQGHRDGYGFAVRLDGAGDDIYLHNRQMRRVFDGDEVLVRLSGDSHRGKDEGTIAEVLVRNTEQLAGRFVTEDGIQFVRPENGRITQDVMIPPGAEAGAQAGQIVVAAITRQPDKNQVPVGKVIQVLGDHMAPGMEIDLAIQAHSIPNVWPKEVTGEAAGIPADVQEQDKQHRVDLRNLPFVTIDGEDARDFDDAVLCERRRGGWRLYVAIADVSHYVQCDSALDSEARLRGNSVYFPDYVVPMLPEALSNGLCSLNPAVDRLCMVCEMNITTSGSISGYKFYEAVMHSHARLTYTKVAEILDNDSNDEHPLRQQYQAVVPQIHLLQKLYQCLRQARDERGAIDFETVETRIEFNQDRKIERIVPVYRNDAHKLIEECMLCANVCAARFLEKHNIPCLYRVHQGPTEEKLANLREFLGELGLGLGGGSKPTSGDFQVLMQSIQDRADSHMIQMVMLRSLRQAVYQVENEGHFGLGYDAYAHFTSPIRRYPDLLVHRAIRSVIRSEQASAHIQRVEGAEPIPARKIYPYGVADMLVMGEQSSLTERRADEATRDVVSWLKCEYLQDQVGEVFPGVVSAVTGFGLFVELKELYVEGLVHITALPQDYYRFEPAQHRLVGERTRKVFGLGDELTVRVVRVDLDNRKVDFEMESVTAARRGGGAARKDAAAAGQTRSGKKPAQSTARGKPGRKSDEQPGKKAGGRGQGGGRKKQDQAASTAKGGSAHGNARKKTQRKAKTAAVRSPQAAPAPQKQSFLAAAATGVKKAFARFKTKK
jgi:ribonuclease R